MDNNKVPEVVPALSIILTRFEIVFTEDPASPLSMVSLPIKDINEMAELEKSSFSLKADVAQSFALENAARQRLYELSQKTDRFDKSATFLNRIANLHSVLGDLSNEESASQRAYDLNRHHFFGRKFGEVRAKLGDAEGARKLFSELAEVDSYSALRLASFGVIQKDLEQAGFWLAEAVRLNPVGYAERLFQGALNLLRGDFQSAISYLRIALEDRPNSSVAYSNLGFAYLGVHRADKAFQSLKRSVALDPFNRNALVALADVGSSLNRDSEILSSLRYFVEFEQRDPSVWGRLARSLIRLNMTDDCVHALKRQGALQPSVAVWNNLGVAYEKLKQYSSSMKAFKHAITVDAEDGVLQDLLVARNIASLVSKTGQFEEAYKVTSSLVDQDFDFVIAKDNKLSDIYSIHMHSLMRLGRTGEALELADKLLNVEGVSEKITKWIVTTEIALYGLERSSDEKLESLIERYTVLRGEVQKQDIRLLNNLAFAYAELGRLKEADECINLISWVVHKDAYVTATLGLINIRKGNIDKGEKLYREAISLAMHAFDKTRIKQKLNIELGKAFAATDIRRSKKHLLNASEEKHGEVALKRQARKILDGIEKSNNL